MSQTLKKKSLNSFVILVYSKVKVLKLSVPIKQVKSDLNFKIIVGHPILIHFHELRHFKPLKLPLILKPVKDLNISSESLNDDSIFLTVNNFYVLDYTISTRCLNLQTMFLAMLKVFEPILKFYLLEIFLFS